MSRITFRWKPSPKSFIARTGSTNNHGSLAIPIGCLTFWQKRRSARHSLRLAGLHLVTHSWYGVSLLKNTNSLATAQITVGSTNSHQRSFDQTFAAARRLWKTLAALR